MKIKDYLEKTIKEKREQFDALQKKSDASNDLAEVRSIGETLKALAEEIKDAEDQLAALEDEPAEDPADETVDSRSFDPVATYTMRGGVNNMRAKEFAATGAMNITGSEARSILLATGSLAKPTGVDGINDAQNTVSSIIDQVYVDDATGMGLDNVAYQKSIQSAGVATDGTASTPSDPVFRVAQIKPVLIDTLTYISKEIRKQTPLQYEEKVKDGAMKALRTKVGKMIINGNGNTEIYGIINAVNNESTPEAIYDTYSVETNEIGADTLRKIVFSHGGDENVGGNAVLYLNKKDLIAFGDVRGTNEKQAVYEIIPDGSNPNTGIIKEGGLAVKYCINSACTALSASTKGSTPIKTMVYGDPTAYKLDLFGDYEVNVSEDYKFAEGLLAIRGEVMVGGNLTVDKGFTVVTL